jgi:hypothetical protein
VCTLTTQTASKTTGTAHKILLALWASWSLLSVMELRAARKGRNLDRGAFVL